MPSASTLARRARSTQYRRSRSIKLLCGWPVKAKRVLRLKGGDPFIFGRGGEEIEEFGRPWLPFQGRAGITAAKRFARLCREYPLTHRDHAQVGNVLLPAPEGCTLISLADLVAPSQTLVFYMAWLGLPEICQQLIQPWAAIGLHPLAVESGKVNSQSEGPDWYSE